MDQVELNFEENNQTLVPVLMKDALDDQIRGFAILVFLPLRLGLFGIIEFEK
jgi:hypothetical protein